MSDTEYLNDQCNPLDATEEFLDTQNWQYDRLSEEQLYFSLEGDKGNYKLFFIWDEAQNALQFCCEIDLCITKDRLSKVHRMLAEVNSQMWLGHFDISTDEHSGCLAPCFRYTTLIRGMEHHACSSLVQDLIKVTLKECERLHDAFYVLDKKNDIAFVDAMNSGDGMELALTETAGRC